MACLNIILSGLPEHELDLLALRDRIAAAWNGAANVQFDVCPTGELNFKVLEASAAVVLLTRGLRGHASMRYVVSMIEQSGVPVLSLSEKPGDARDPFKFAGHFVQPENAEPIYICGALQALVHRQGEIKRLQRELTISTKQHGGLRQQITQVHEELQLAAMVQKEYLPREMPELHGVDFAVLWRPASYVSGDIYDVTRLDEDHIGVFVADAVGHGVPAALLTMIICKSLRTKVISERGYRILTPSEVLHNMNREMIHRRDRATRFATAIYMVINCRSRTVQLARAGHPAPLLLSADSGSRFIEPSGGLLGVFADEEYEQEQFDLHVGDRILLYSDGFEQAFPDLHDDSSGRPLPNRKYLDVFDELRAEDGAERLVETLAERLDGHQGSLHPQDDLTLLCVHAGTLKESEHAHEEHVAMTRAQSAAV